MTQQSEIDPQQQDHAATTERMNKAFLFSYRAQAGLYNVFGLTVMPFTDLRAVVPSTGPVLDYIVARTNTLAVSGMIERMAITYVSRQSRRKMLKARESVFGPDIDINTDRMPQTRSGSELMANYVGEKIRNTLPQHKWARANQVSAATHALRQNVLVQTWAYTPLIWATALDCVGYGLQAVFMGGKRVQQNKFFLRNTCKAMLTDMGLIAPSEDNMTDIVNNASRTLLNRSNGRMGYECYRVAEERITAAREKLRP